MKGNFTRDSFDPTRGYTQVLLEAGRPVMDADFNEQGAINRLQLRKFIQDILGEHAGPKESFEVRRRNGADQLIWIGAGHYYVGGALVEHDREVPVPFPPAGGGNGAPAADEYLIYLEVWEQDVGPISEPAITDPGVADVTTAVRARTAWRPRVRRLAPDLCDPEPPCELLRWVEEVAEHAERCIEREASRLRKDVAEIEEDAEQAAAAVDEWLEQHLTASNRRRHADRIKELHEEHRKYRRQTPWALEPPSAEERRRALEAIDELRRHSPPRLRATLSDTFTGESSLYRVEVHVSGPPSGIRLPAPARINETMFSIRELRRDSAANSRQTVVLDVRADEPAAPREEDWLEIIDGALSEGVLVKVASVDREDDSTLIVTLADDVELADDLPALHAMVRRCGTFKVSRDNGASVLGIRSAGADNAGASTTLILEAPGAAQHELDQGDWLEILDDGLLRDDLPGPIVQVASASRQDDSTLLVTLARPTELPGNPQVVHAFVRRWDGAPRPVVADNELPLDADDQPYSGIGIEFHGRHVRSGDYWLIPVREQLTLVWPPTQHGDPFVPARGEHSFAPLALVSGSSVRDLRCKIRRLTEP